VIPLPRDLFFTALPGLGRPLTAQEGNHLSNYLKILIKWQKTHRLVGSTDPRWLIENVFIDSLAFLALFPSGTRAVADIGSGAGIPGVPIAIVRPDLRVALIEARRIRASFLATVVREVPLGQAEVVAGRVESLESTLGGRFDVAVMRCVGASDTIASRGLAVLRPGGALIISAPPQVDPGAELATVALPGGRQRRFAVMRKP
jgi:16S rRNA (guanine527-N7)-methyltransferase